MAHAEFSASGSDRWLNCPGSIRLARIAPKGRSSVYAMEGTAAHYIGERCISNNVKPASYKGFYLEVNDGEVKAYKSSKPLDILPPNVFLVDDEMITAVEVYVDLIEDIRKEHPDADEYIEKRLDLSFVRPNMFGTGDYISAEWLGTLYVVDYKHGKGVKVDPVENSQLMYYGLGAAKLVDFDIERVVLIVVQPRIYDEEGPVRRWDTTVERLKRFEKELAEGYDRAQENDSMLVAGDWCKFCPALGVPGLCTAAEEKVMEIAKSDFAEMPIDGVEGSPVIPFPANKIELEKALAWLPFIDAWSKKVAAHAETLALGGEKIQGRKLVEKKTNRKWNDFIEQEELEKELSETFNIEVKDLYEEPKFLSPAKVEKMLTAAKKRELAATGLIIKPTGALTLVKDSDPRAEVIPQLANDKAAEDFKES